MEVEWVRMEVGVEKEGSERKMENKIKVVNYNLLGKPTKEDNHVSKYLTLIILALNHHKPYILIIIVYYSSPLASPPSMQMFPCSVPVDQNMLLVMERREVDLSFLKSSKIGVGSKTHNAMIHQS